MSGPLLNASFDSLETRDEAALDESAVRIERADNGFIVRQGPRVEVIEEQDTDDGEAEAAQALCYLVLEMVGRLGTKHDAFRVRVELVDQRSGEGN